MELVAIGIGLVVLLLLMALISRRGGTLDKAYYTKKWRGVEQAMKTPDIGPKMAVIEADKLLDNALKKSKFRGETMGERLRSAERALKNYQAVWDAHKLRNRLVHEDVVLKKRQATSALGAFRSALKSLGAL